MLWNQGLTNKNQYLCFKQQNSLFSQFLNWVKMLVLLKPKVGSGCSLLKNQKEARLVERKVCFILDAGSWGWGKGGRLSKGRLPPSYNQPARAFIDGGRGLHAGTAQSALTGVLKLVTWWSHQRHLGCCKYSYSSVPGSVCSHFLEANSWNCGSLGHGYSLVIM